MRQRIYLSIQKDQQREEDDRIAVVLQIENVYFQKGTYSRGFQKTKNLSKIGSAFVANFHKMIEDIMQGDQFLPILYVRTYEELGCELYSLV